MTKTQLLDAIRNIKKNFVSYISILLISMLSAATYMGVTSASINLENGANDFYKASNFYDLEVVSSLLLSEDDIDAIRSLDQVESVVPFYFVSARTENNGVKENVSVMTSTGDMCVPTITDGEEPDTANECMIEDRLAESLELGVGDTITILGDDGEEAPYLLGTDFEITGIYQTTQHIKPSIKDNSYITVTEEAFDTEALKGCYMRAYVKLNDTKDDNIFKEKYTDKIDEAKKAFEDLASERTALRDADIRATYQSEIDDYAEILDEGKEKLDAAQASISDAEEEIAEGDKKLEDSSDELNELKAKLEAGLEELESAKSQLDTSKATLDSSKATLDSSKTTLDEKLNDLNTAEETLTTYDKEISTNEEKLVTAEAELSSARASLDTNKAKLDAAKVTLDSSKAALDSSKETLDTNKASLDSAKISLDSAKTTLDSAKTTLDLNKTKLDSAKETLDSAEETLKTNKETLDSNKETLDSNKETLDESKEKLDAGKQTLEDSFYQAEAVKTEVRDKISNKVTLFLWFAGIDKEINWSSEITNVDVTTASIQDFNITDSFKADILNDTVETLADRFITTYLIPDYIGTETYDYVKQKYEEFKATYGISIDIENAKLEAAREKIRTWNTGRQEYVSNLADYNAGLADYNIGLADYNAGLEQYNAGYEEYSSGMEQYNAGYAEYSAGLAEYNSGLAEYNSKLADYNAGLAAYTEGEAKYNAGLAEYNEGLAIFAEGEKAYNSGLATYNENYETYISSKGQVESARSSWNESKSTYESNLESYQTAVNTYESSLSEYNSYLSEWNDKNDEYQAGLEEYNSGRDTYNGYVEEYEEGLKKLEEYKEELEDKKEEYSSSLSDYEKGKETLEDMQKQLDDMETCKWFVSGVEANVGYRHMGMTVDSVKNMGDNFTILFVILAALIIYATMARLISEQHKLVGATKAFGFYKREIFSKYLLFGLSALVFGLLFGVLVSFGFQKFAIVTFVNNYVLETPATKAVPHVIILVVIAALIITISAVILATASLLKQPAVELLREASPKGVKGTSGGKHILTLFQRLILRNVISDKMRVLVTFASIASCCALVNIGFSMKFDLSKTETIEYDQKVQYDYNLEYDVESKESSLEDVEEILKKYKADYANAMSYYSTFKVDGGGDIVEVVVTDVPSLERYYEFLDYDSRAPLTLGKDGVYIKGTYAKSFDIEPGDSIIIMNSRGVEVEAKVAGIYENYLGQKLYMDSEYYSSLFQEEPEMNKCFVACDKSVSDDLAKELEANSYVHAVEDATEDKTLFASYFKSLNGLLVLILFVAVLMAGIIISNLTFMYIIQKKVEIIIMRINGYSFKEVRTYLLNESFFTTILGIIGGLLFGSVLARNIIGSFEKPHLAIYKGLNLKAWLFSALVTMFFSLVINFIALKRVREMKMTDIANVK
ncbi:FtsX-like permease family protein [Lachnospiraceae bacterium NE2001]|nr:FtsX-like permease family protein [Lachnospiraceae bacterium NE2001]